MTSFSGDFTKRYAIFIERCTRVASTYGLTLEQYLDCTVRRDKIERASGIHFAEANLWSEKREFMRYHEEQLRAEGKQDTPVKKQKEEE